MSKKIAVLAGDGIGPEIMKQGLKVLGSVSSLYGHSFSFTEGLIGGAAYKKQRNHFPESTQQLCRQADAVLFGSVGGPVSAANNPQHPEYEIWNNSEKNSLLGLRKMFNFGVNLRPCKVYPELTHLSPLKSSILTRGAAAGEGLEFLIIRELVGDVYFGKHETHFDETTKEFIAFDEMSYTSSQIASPVKFAFKAASNRTDMLGKKTNVTIVDKANVLDTSRLWRKVAKEEFEKLDSKVKDKINLQFMFVDNAAMQLVLNPNQFDIIVTGNLFGDILSDAASVIPGSLGLMPSASLNPESGLHMFEPSGGSAPDIAGKDIANPIGQILSAALMLEYSFGMMKEKELIEKSVHEVLKAGFRTNDLRKREDKASELREIIVGTEAFGDEVVRKMKELYINK